ncbi:MAG: four helix bundle protein [Candidatus Liptonbacteria bacterium]|nr:four helix bundle protein [Candidatus Liptonbacteria bacterium]
MESYKELTVWQKAINLVEEVYKLTAEFPKDELYGLVNQMRRASVSIPSNVAEGSRRKDLPEYLHFLRISDGLASELETQVIIARRLYPELKYTRVEGLLLEIQKMLNVLIIRLELKVRERA